jgi:hypothetical protein
MQQIPEKGPPELPCLHTGVVVGNHLKRRVVVKPPDRNPCIFIWSIPTGPPLHWLSEQPHQE